MRGEGCFAILSTISLLILFIGITVSDVLFYNSIGSNVVEFVECFDTQTDFFGDTYQISSECVVSIPSTSGYRSTFAILFGILGALVMIMFIYSVVLCVCSSCGGYCVGCLIWVESYYEKEVVVGETEQSREIPVYKTVEITKKKEVSTPGLIEIRTGEFVPAAIKLGVVEYKESERVVDYYRTETYKVPIKEKRKFERTGWEKFRRRPFSFSWTICHVCNSLFVVAFIITLCVLLGTVYSELSTLDSQFLAATKCTADQYIQHDSCNAVQNSTWSQFFK